VKRENEFAVGLVVIAALAVVVVGALWLSGAHLGKTEAVFTARFRTVGGLGVGNPVVLRGVRVGRVEAIRLASGNWVEADLKIYSGVSLPAKPAVIAASASLFGEWAATLISSDPPPSDPNVRQALAEAQAGVGGGGGGKWPGATLPDIGQLTAQASRIATDIATVSARIQTAFDSEAVSDLRRSIRDFGQIADRLARVTNEQADVIGNVGSNLSKGSDVLARAATDLQATLGRVDSATNQGQLATILNNTAASSADLRSASQDFRELMGAANKNQESLVRVLVSADTVLSRIANRSGTLGLVVGDSALYRETTLTMIQLRQLLADIQVNPRKYFQFSVF
jgi:phospholipid/cholesterol/gamma-HCH transport system substrate-binding protein